MNLKKNIYSSEASVEAGLHINSEKIKCILISHQYNTGQKGKMNTLLHNSKICRISNIF
jgi:hypothetical protein